MASGPVATPTPLQLRIVRHIARGATDAAIARRERISERTIRRRLREVMDHAGTRSRAQLVAEAAVRGWLASDNS